MNYDSIMIEMLRVTAGDTQCRIIDTETDNASHTSRSIVYEGIVSHLLDKHKLAISAIHGHLFIKTECVNGEAVLVIKRYHDKEVA